MISKLNTFKHLILNSKTHTFGFKDTIKRSFAVDVTAMNKELNKCNFTWILNSLEIKISLSKNGHPLYFDN